MCQLYKYLSTHGNFTTQWNGIDYARFTFSNPIKDEVFICAYTVEYISEVWGTFDFAKGCFTDF